MDGAVLTAFGLSLLAGLSTLLGAAAALGRRPLDEARLASALGLSAAVMLWVSVLELLPAALEQASRDRPDHATLLVVLALLTGVGIVLAVDRLVPVTTGHPGTAGDLPADLHRRRLLRTGAFTAGAIALHNLPEGFATFVSALEDPRLGVGIAAAIALHNVPEGVAVAVPVRHATGSRRTAVVYTLIAGLAEPLGALLGYLVMAPALTPSLLAATLAGVAGIMIALGPGELLPSAARLGGPRRAAGGFLVGTVVTVLGLLALP